MTVSYCWTNRSEPQGADACAERFEVRNFVLTLADFDFCASWIIGDASQFQSFNVRYGADGEDNFSILFLGAKAEEHLRN